MTRDEHSAGGASDADQREIERKRRKCDRLRWQIDTIEMVNREIDKISHLSEEQQWAEYARLRSEATRQRRNALARERRAQRKQAEQAKGRGKGR